MRPPLSILASESGLLLFRTQLEHNSDFTSCHVVSSMQVLLSMHVVAWVTILWPLRRTRSYFLPCLHLWCILQRFLLHHILSLPSGLKILMLWRLFQPRLRRDVLVSKFALVVMEFCGIHLFMNFQFLI
jgi:hypothetical protein